MVITCQEDSKITLGGDREISINIICWNPVVDRFCSVTFYYEK